MSMKEPHLQSRGPGPGRWLVVGGADGPRPDRHRRRPSLEGLEGRALMSHAGGPDGTFGRDGVVSEQFPNFPSFQGPNTEFGAVAIRPDGKVIAAGDSTSIFTPL